MKQCTKCNEVKELTEFHKGRSNCKQCHNTQAALYRKNNPDKVKASKQKYYKENREAVIAGAKLWASRNKEANRKNKRNYRRNRYSNDAVFRLTDILRSRLHNALVGKNKSASTIELLGCTPEHARLHIESQFTEGMTWDNIHVDHIQPCASFDLEDPNEQRKCFHYTNLQPLFASDNLRKSDQIVPEHQVRLL